MRSSRERPGAMRYAHLRRALLVGALVIGPSAGAQDRPVGPVTAGVGLIIAQPTGVFAETTNLGVGLSGNALFRLDPNAIFNIRTELSFVNYGNVNQRVPLSPTLGNLIQVNLRTSNNIASFLVGPQLLGPTGTFTVYGSALGGFSAFWTTSSVEGTNEQSPFASTTNSSDFAWAYGGAAGVYIRVTDGERPVRLELGMRVLRHDNVTYLTADEVRAAQRENRFAQPIRSRVDFYTYLIGAQMIIF